MTRHDLTLGIGALVILLTLILLIRLEPLPSAPLAERPAVMSSQFLTDPFLQDPTPTSVVVVWFTEFEGQGHRVYWGEPGQPPPFSHQVMATSRPLSRSREDPDSHLNHPDFADLTGTVPRPIWRHQARVEGLTPGQRLPYQVSSTPRQGAPFYSPVFSLAPAPQAGQPWRVLLTSDHQTMPMTAANLQKVEETLGRVDALFLAGDLVNVPDRASEWFDDSRGNAFFPCLQGRAHYPLDRGGRTRYYRGGELIQHAPLFPALGNHEVMGRFSYTALLKEQFNSPRPRSVAIQDYEARADLFNPSGDDALRRRWIIDNSFNSDTYEEIFTLPQTAVPNPDRPEQTSRYYATTLGEVRLVSLYVTQIWRPYQRQATVQGRYQEREADLATPANWGYGQHIFESIAPDSLQYQWLTQELASPAFRQARYRVVMLHHPPHTLGDNIVPPFTDPVPRYDRDGEGRLRGVYYDYPIAQDQIAQHLIPLLESAGVDLVFYGHSHLWNRFRSPSGTHYLETSNVGNSYGAFWRDQTRPVPGPDHGTPQDYLAQGDPNGLEPVPPSLVAPQRDSQGQPLPYLASNDLTAFSLLSLPEGVVSSYYFDTRQPQSAVVKFDEFHLRG